MVCLPAVKLHGKTLANNIIQLKGKGTLGIIHDLNALAVWLNSVGRYLIGATGNYFSNPWVGMVSR